MASLFEASAALRSHSTALSRQYCPFPARREATWGDTPRANNASGAAGESTRQRCGTLTAAEIQPTNRSGSQ